MHLKNINLILMLIAGIIVGIISIVMSYSTQRLMFTLLVVLIIFFIIGTVIQGLANNIFEKTDQEERDKEIADLEEEEMKLETESDDGDIAKE